MVLTKMKEIAEAYLGHPVTNAVITVPATSTTRSARPPGCGGDRGAERAADHQRADRRRIAYGLDRTGKGERNVHLRPVGGTFDVSILTIDDGIFEVKATAGDTHLGGEDFDNRLVNHFVESSRGSTRRTSQNKRAVRRLRTACERAKRTLSSSTQASLRDRLPVRGHRLLHVHHQGAVRGAVLGPVPEHLGARGEGSARRKLDKAQIHDLVLVGAPPRIPKVQKLLQDFFNGGAT
ncbi:Heat shock 70 kDa protein 1B [Camelus dromedarius]|uniref:Heat shock 70 kDa protein 1B n=1 Tax=Camelus dromedarius TaxID=9838 RepID=A0A5N4CRH5_CAMDR|nr:Heat shock 70 kDa protein 1B [Camelus dromedarius]